MPDSRGYFGPYGGRYVPETLMPALEALAAEYASARDDAGTHAVRLRDLEDRVNRLKAEYNRARYRLALLAEKTLDRRFGGARAELAFHSEVRGALALERVVFTLDGELVYARVDRDGDLAELGEISLFDGELSAGDHVLSVRLEYRGQGLPYMDGYHVAVRSSHAFTVGAGQALDLRIVGVERGVLQPLTERLAIRFVERISARD